MVETPSISVINFASPLLGMLHDISHVAHSDLTAKATKFPGLSSKTVCSTSSQGEWNKMKSTKGEWHMAMQMAQITDDINEQCDHWSHRVLYKVVAVGHQRFRQSQHVQCKFIVSNIISVQ